ncbi:MAG: glycosyltransferase [Eubacteriales bacterium]|nr:glycosyltransferase [Eubacteriales bacterium]
MLSNRSCYHTSAFGGAEVSMKLIAEMLANKHHEVYYLTKKFTNYYQIGTVKSKVNRVAVHAVNYYPTQHKLLRHPYTKIKYLFIKQYNDYQSKVFTQSLVKFIVKKGIQIVYCFYELNLLNKLLDIKMKQPSFKIVMRIAGNHWYEQCKKDNSLIKGYERAFNAIDSINFLYEGMEDEFKGKLRELDITIHIKHKFVGDIGSAVEIGRPIPYRQDHNKFEMIMAARFSQYQKRQDILVQAMSLIPEELPIRLHLIGEGTQKESIGQLVAALNVRDRVIIEPFYEQSALWQRLLNAQLLCHACDYEGVSKIIIESQSIGLPVLASDVPPLNEHIQEKINGFLVKNDPQAWAEKIIWLYHNRNLLARVSEHSLEEIKCRFDPQMNVLIYEQAFQEIIQNELDENIEQKMKAF